MDGRKTQTWIYVRSDNSMDISRLIRTAWLIPDAIDFVVLDFAPTGAVLPALAWAGEPFRYLSTTKRTGAKELVQLVLAEMTGESVHFFVTDGVAAWMQGVIRERLDDVAINGITEMPDRARYSIVSQSRLFVPVTRYWLHRIAHGLMSLNRYMPRKHLGDRSSGAGSIARRPG
jgi:hypothetical protein